MESLSQFAQQLRRSRRNARLSQLELAMRAGISQRHLSFMESGRAQPGRKVVMQLARGLDPSGSIERDLLLAAGYAPRASKPTFDSSEMQAVREAAERILDHHNPYPGLLMDRAYFVIRTNEAFDDLLARIAHPPSLWKRTACKGRANLLKLSLHPAGLRNYVEDFRAYASALLLRTERASIHFPEIRPVLDDLLEDPVLAGILNRPSLIDTNQIGPAWMENYRLDGRNLKLFSVQSSIGVPMDQAAESLLLECFFPGDTESAELLQSGRAP